MILGTCPSGWNCPITTTAAGTTTATVAQWAQCGGFYSQNNFMFETQFLYLKGIGYTGNTQCGYGFTCYVQNAYWSACMLSGSCPRYLLQFSITKVHLNIFILI